MSIQSKKDKADITADAKNQKTAITENAKNQKSAIDAKYEAELDKLHSAIKGGKR